MVEKKKKKMKAIKNKTKINNPKIKSKIAEKNKTPVIEHKKNNKTYWEYYSLIIFLIFCVLFISVLIVFVFSILGSKYLWVVIPTTLILWGISYLLAKAFLKKSQK
ncbi:MAG: hypothetical protein WCX82_02915 [archaeon]